MTMYGQSVIGLDVEPDELEDQVLAGPEDDPADDVEPDDEDWDDDWDEDDEEDWDDEEDLE